MLVAGDGERRAAAVRTATSSGGAVVGPYEIESLIARGGMGEVYRARDTRYGRTVALKLLPESLSADPAYRERFRREAHLTAQLREPHIVPIHGFGEIDGRLFLDMRLIEGEDLATLVRRAGRLEPGRAVGLVEQVAQALDAAHQQGLVHRDVKPSNIIVTPHDFAYLVDFGIAQSPGSRTLTATGSVIGTWDYMAPERFRGDASGPAADVYALACVLVEAVTGRPPFPAADIPEAINAHLNATPPRLAGTDPRLGPAFDAVVAAGLAKDPAHRPLRAPDLAGAARRALGSPHGGTASAPTHRGTRSLPVPREPLDQPRETAPTPFRWAVLGAVVAVVVVLAALVTVVLVARDGGGATSSSSSQSVAGSAAGASAAPAPAAAAPATAADGQAAVAAVRDYYTLVPAYLDEAWTFIGPTLRLRGGGFADYQRHWSQYSQVRLVDATATDASTVQATILMLTDGSARRTEVHSLRLVPGENGRLLIDADALVSSRSGS